MSGHFATLLRGTAQTLHSEHDVYITDWQRHCRARGVAAFGKRPICPVWTLT
jgi:poly-beta-hydroxyalkanoate depolymerase